MPAVEAAVRAKIRQVGTPVADRPPDSFTELPREYTAFYVLLDEGEALAVREGYPDEDRRWIASRFVSRKRRTAQKRLHNAD